MDSYAVGNSDNKALNDALLTFGLNVAPQNLVNRKIQSQWAQQGLSGVVKGALSRGATRAALAATAMGIDTWLNEEESDFAVAKKAYMAMGLSEEKAVNQIKADGVRYILGEGLSGAAEGFVAAGLEVGRYKKTAEEVGKTVKESGEAAELLGKLDRLPEDTEAKRLFTKARDAFMEKAEKKLNRLKDAYEEENHGDLTIGKIERIGQLSKDIKDYEAYVKEVLDGWEFVDEKRLGEIVLALDESEVWRLPKNSRKLFQEMQAETVGQREGTKQEALSAQAKTEVLDAANSAYQQLTYEENNGIKTYNSHGLVMEDTRWKEDSTRYYEKIRGKSKTGTASDEANKFWLNRGYKNQPYKQNTVVYEIVLDQDTKFVRCYDGVISSRAGSWCMLEEDIINLTPNEIREKYALPALPAFSVDVIVPAGTSIRMGIAEGIAGWGRGGGIQFDLAGQRVAQFGKARTLKWRYKN